MSKKVLVPIAPGTEEMEAITIIDMMVRAGYETVVASADFDGNLVMKASRGVTLTADCKLVEIADDEFDAV
ncbi:DJ-1/PfpI family protein, partial [Vibrio hepatarius]|uniref:DJ-1/PfpI family protein n=1 Tax=Vibrio hepatarius TaxID=171383 RepID=UPI00158B27B3